MVRCGWESTHLVENLLFTFSARTIARNYSIRNLGLQSAAEKREIDTKAYDEA
jgi:hypothetical protein